MPRSALTRDAPYFNLKNMTREEAIHEIKQWDFINNDEMEALRTLIPELRESEDERIRKELIEFIKWSVDRHFMREDFHQAKRPSEWIAYLEKQKELTPADGWDYADKRMSHHLYLEGFEAGRAVEREMSESAAEWSEEHTRAIQIALKENEDTLKDLEHKRKKKDNFFSRIRRYISYSIWKTGDF